MLLPDLIQQVGDLCFEYLCDAKGDEDRKQRVKYAYKALEQALASACDDLDLEITFRRGEVTWIENV